MACYGPLDGWRSRTVNESGLRSVVFELKEGYHDLPVSLPCGQCVGCRLEKSRQWAMRCMHEASLNDENCFITLTHDDDHLPKWGSLDKSAFPKFMKRLRKRHDGQSIRYYHAGEYGDRFGRPHYHSCLFGFDFRDKVPWTSRGDFPVWRSPELEELWPYGQSELGSVTFESAAYVARYITKKVTGARAEDYYSVTLETGEVVHVQPEYATMSRKPGIGKEWFDKFGCEVYAADSVIVRGKEMKPPRFYDGQHELVDPDGMARIKRSRKRARNPDEERGKRLFARGEVAKARLNLKVGGV